MKNFSIVVIVVILAILGFWLLNDRNAVQDDTGAVPTQSANPTQNTAAAKKSPTASPAASNNVQSKTYTQLVAEYKDRRIQFDQFCQAIPNYITFKAGQSVMLDNRSGDSRYVKVGSDVHKLDGYGYKIVTLVGSVPKTLDISCGSAVNVGKILLQGNISNTD